jgi:hypothetical protein
MQTIDLWTHGGLFSGIGGFDLAAGWNDIENIFHCEVNPFSQYILKHYWPNSIQHDNVETADFTIHRGKIRILSGGFPCQDNSNANQSDTRKSGLQGLRTGLAFHMLRSDLSLLCPKMSEIFLQLTEEKTLEQYSGNWPEWGIMQNGEFAVRQMSVPPITGRGCISLLTPTASEWKRDKLSFPMYQNRINRSPGSLSEHLFRLIGAVPGHLSHLFLSWTMGFPIQWLDLQHHNGEEKLSKPLGTR